MSDALRLEVDTFDVDVVLIEPGPVLTGFNGRLEDELDELGRSPEYDWLYETIEEFNLAASSLPVASEPEDVATLIHDVAHMSNPKARYPVGPVGKLMLYSRFLPDGVRDSMYRVLRKVV